MIKLLKILFLFLIFPAVGFTNSDDCQKLLNFTQKYFESIHVIFYNSENSEEV
jgi:hypothetical protein